MCLEVFPEIFLFSLLNYPISNYLELRFFCFVSVQSVIKVSLDF